MPAPQVPLRWHEVVRSHHGSTIGYGAAQSGDCLRIRDDERRLVHGRAFKPLAMDALPNPHDLSLSWFLGVILCPGDDTEALAQWARRLKAIDLDRIHFYHTPAVALGAALASWGETGLREPRTYEVRGFASFHRLYGRHHADRVYLDHSNR